MQKQLVGMLVSGTLAASVSSVWANNDKAEEQHQLATQSTKITQKSTKKDNKDAKKIKPMSLMTLDTDAPANNPNSLMRAHVGQTGFTSVDPYSGSMIFHIPLELGIGHKSRDGRRNIAF